jgi:hypothetical protein
MSIKEIRNNPKKIIIGLKPRNLTIAASSLSIFISVFCFICGRVSLAPEDPKAPDPITSTNNENARSTVENSNNKSKSTSNSKNDAEILKWLLPIISTFIVSQLFPWFIKVYVFGTIEEESKRDKAKAIRKPGQTEKKLRENLDSEFLSNLSDLKRVKFKHYGESIYGEQGGESYEGLTAKIHKYNIDTESCREAYEGILEGFKKSPREKYAPFHLLIVEACNRAVGILDNKGQNTIESFYDDIHQYLKAWLLCSLKYNVPIPVIPPIKEFSKIFSDSSGKQKNINVNYQTYIMAIKYIQESGLSSDAMKKFIVKQKARDMCNKYLDDLILLLEAEIKLETEIEVI